MNSNTSEVYDHHGNPAGTETRFETKSIRSGNGAYFLQMVEDHKRQGWKKITGTRYGWGEWSCKMERQIK